MGINKNDIMYKPRIHLLNALRGKEVPQTVGMHRQRKRLEDDFQRIVHIALRHRPTHRPYIGPQPWHNGLPLCHLCLPQVDEDVRHDVRNRPLTLHRLCRKPEESPSTLQEAPPGRHGAHHGTSAPPCALRLRRVRLQLGIGIPRIAIRLAQTTNADTDHDRLTPSILLPLPAQCLVLLPEDVSFAP
jgi:hypothetical protein